MKIRIQRNDQISSVRTCFSLFKRYELPKVEKGLSVASNTVGPLNKPHAQPLCSDRCNQRQMGQNSLGKNRIPNDRVLALGQPLTTAKKCNSGNLGTWIQTLCCQEVGSRYS